MLNSYPDFLLENVKCCKKEPGGTSKHSQLLMDATAEGDIVLNVAKSWQRSNTTSTYPF